MVSKILWKASRAMSKGAALLRKGAGRLQDAQAQYERRKDIAALKGLDLLERVEYFLTGEVTDPDEADEE